MSHGVSRSGASISRQKNSIGELQSASLDSSTTQVDLDLGIIAEKATIVMNGTLTGTISFSINGKDFFSSTALGATGIPVDFNAHLFKKVRIARSTGSGMVTIACK